MSKQNVTLNTRGMRFGYYKQKMKIAIFLFLISLTLNQTVLLLSNVSSTTIISPTGYSIVQEAYHTSANPNFLGNGAEWIWLNGSDAWPNGFTSTFQAVFNADCPQVPATLTISADNIFNAYLNGVFIGNGTSWQVKYTFAVNLQCGCNSLVVIAENLNTGSPASLVFSVTQNQASCYQCNATPASFYNRNTCMCQCTSTCTCSQNQIWQVYPVCGCVCAKVQVCQKNHYWNGQTCACQCLPISCPKGEVQNPLTCLCQFNKIIDPNVVPFPANLATEIAAQEKKKLSTGQKINQDADDALEQANQDEAPSNTTDTSQSPSTQEVLSLLP